MAAACSGVNLRFFLLYYYILCAESGKAIALHNIVLSILVETFIGIYKLHKCQAYGMENCAVLFI